MKIINQVIKTYYWSNMWKDIQEYIRKYNVCKLNKYEKHKFYEKLQSVKISKESWKIITMNFIIKLFKFKNSITEFEYNSILMIVNKMIKYTYFISMREEDINIKITTWIILKKVFFKHKILRKIISDRNRKFVSKFWQILIVLIEIQHAPSTIYHKKIDNQSEILNQIIEIYLRYYVNYQQNNWIKLLSMREIVYNESKNTSINMILYYTNYNKKSDFMRIFWKLENIAQETKIKINKL